MISTWSAWKRIRARPRREIEAPISPGIYEVRIARPAASFVRGGRQTSRRRWRFTGRFQIWFGAARALGLPDLDTAPVRPPPADAKARRTHDRPRGNLSERRGLILDVIPGMRSIEPESRDSPMCNCTSEVWC